MKLNKKVIISAIVSATLFIGCTVPSVSGGSNQKEVVSNIEIDEKDVGLRNVSLYSEAYAVTPGVYYNKAMAGTSTKFERAFEDAPPMIPHDTEGMLPIKRDNNQCIDCHMPAVASSMGATPIPGSHLVNMRPVTSIDKRSGAIIKNGNAVHNTSDVKEITVRKLGGELYKGRFNCSQCHAPQAQLEPMVANSFEADYSRKVGSQNKSDYLNNLDELKLDY